MSRGLLVCFLLVTAAPLAGHPPWDLSSVGDVRFQNSGKTEAQSAFLYGLAQLHNFEYEDAAKAFVQAEQIDPRFAMAYWGEAMTKNHPIWMEQDRDAAVAALRKLAADPRTRQALAGTPREKAYLKAVEILFGEGTKEDRDFRYATAMRELAQTYPDDENAQTFYALALMGTAHNGRDVPTYMKATAILEDVFHEHPRHPGAAHYLIHSVDDPVHAILGLNAARAYSKIAPRAGHAQHMTSHIFLALGMWGDVVHANEVAVNVVNTQRSADGKPPAFCGHYNEWLEYAYLEQGRARDARALLEKCGSQVGGDDHMRGHASSSYISMWARYLFDTDEWSGSLAQWHPDDPSVESDSTYEFTRGFGEVRRGELDAARGTLDRFRKLRKEQDEELERKGEMATSRRKRAEIFEQQLQAMLLNAGGNRESAITLLRTAAATEDSLPAAFGPPFVEKPSSELLGEMLLEAKRPAEAEIAFRASLARAPRRTSSLLGLARAARINGNTEIAEETLATLKSIWEHAESIPADIKASSR
ncbi:MAG: hypothetical protein ABI718_07455 [Acidobacteriota bacterium]